MLETTAEVMHARATTLADHFATRALETEQLGRLPDESVSQLIEMGITRLVMPRSWGGLELGFGTVVNVVAALARGCMSTAWCAALYAEHPWILAHFDPQAQADVWSAGPDVPLSMSVAARGRGRPVAGGLQLTGTWPFVSGCDHAQWFLLATEWEAENGSGLAARTGLCLVPAAKVSIDHASWRVAGLRGTGSKTLHVDGLVVPGYRVRDSEALVSARLCGAHSKSPLFRQPFGATLGLALTAAAIGGAEGALEQFRQRSTRRVMQFQNRVQAADPAAHLDLAEATLRVESARLLLENACAIVHAAGEQSINLEDLALAELRVRKAFATRSCTEAIDRLFASSGGSALQETNPLQRFWRDVHAIQAHAGMNWNSHAQNYGSVAVGLGPTIHRPW